MFALSERDKTTPTVRDRGGMTFRVNLINAGSINGGEGRPWLPFEWCEGMRTAREWIHFRIEKIFIELKKNPARIFGIDNWISVSIINTVPVCESFNFLFGIDAPSNMKFGESLFNSAKRFDDRQKHLTWKAARFREAFARIKSEPIKCKK